MQFSSVQRWLVKLDGRKQEGFFLEGFENHDLNQWSKSSHLDLSDKSDYD